jgi:CheY-like chemotaxis protein
MAQLEGPNPRSDASRIPQLSAAAPLDVLVADDDPASRTALCTAVVSLGHRCRGAASGLEALAAHRDRPADVIVSDWSMPGIDGMELCRRVRALDAGTYTYLLFTSARQQARLRRGRPRRSR